MTYTFSSSIVYYSQHRPPVRERVTRLLQRVRHVGTVGGVGVPLQRRFELELVLDRLVAEVIPSDQNFLAWELARGLRKDVA